MENKKPIKSFKDLEIYQSSYEAMILIHKELLSKLPESEKYDLKDQLSRSTKTIPRLIAEGYAKRHQKAGFQKYLDDVMGECNETVVGIETSRDLYNIDSSLCSKLITIYDRVGRQTYNLRMVWKNFTSPISNN